MSLSFSPSSVSLLLLRLSLWIVYMSFRVTEVSSLLLRLMSASSVFWYASFAPRMLRVPKWFPVSSSFARLRFHPRSML